MEKLASPLLSLLPDSAKSVAALLGADDWGGYEIEMCAAGETPDWAPPQKKGMGASVVRPSNDHYEFWQGFSW